MRNDLKFCLEKHLMNVFNGCLNNLTIDKYELLSTAGKEPTFKANLFDQLNIYIKENFIGKILVEELAISRKAGILEGLSSEERFASFITMTNIEDWTDYFSYKYPNAILMIKNFISESIDNVCEMIYRFYQDYPTLKSLFNIEDTFQYISLFKSDLHNSSQSVAIFHFTKKNIYYKPKPVALEKWFESFVLTCLKLTKYEIAHKFPKIYDGKTYGWVEEIKHGIAQGTAAEKKYFYTLGQFTAIFHALGSYDLINDNIICSDGIPVFIDLETLFYKKRATRFTSQVNKNSNLTKSIQKLGILPNANTFSLHNTQDFDGALVPRPNSFTVYAWKNKGLDTMHQTLESLSNQPVDQTHLPFNPSSGSWKPAFKAHFLAGFESAYRSIFINFQSLFNKDLFKDLERLPIRVLMRNTVDYGKILSESSHPKILCKHRSFRTYLSQIRDFSKKKHINNTIINNEIKQLQVFNIPYYYGYFNDKCLYDQNSVLIKNYFEGNDLAFVLDNIATLNEGDLSFQKNMINQKIDFYLNESGIEKHDYPFHRKIDLINDKDKDLKNSCLKASEIIGELLIEKSLIGKNEVNFLCKTYSGVENVRNINFLNEDLYNGKTGIALFFLYLYKSTKKIKYYRMSKKMLVAYFTKFKKSKINLSDYDGPINPYFAPLDLLYLSYHFMKVTNEHVFFDKIYLLIKPILFSLKPAKSYDYLTGISGLLVFLLDISKERSEIEVICETLANQIIDAAIPVESDKHAWPSEDFRSIPGEKTLYLGGFSHGATGIAYALSKFYAINKSKPAHIKQAIYKALNYEKSLFEVDKSRYADKRFGLDLDLASVFWCHGSAGVLLGQLLITDYLNEDFLNQRTMDNENVLDRILQDIITSGIGTNYCLCHGDMSNLEILYTIADQTSNTEIKDTVMKYVSAYANAINTGKLKELPSYETLGLFEGLSGLGYNLLRFQDWKGIPTLIN